MNTVNVTINQTDSSNEEKSDNKPLRDSFLKKNFTVISFLIILTLGIAISFCERNYYWSIAFLWSGFLGSFAYKIHTETTYENQSWPRIIHQFIFNFGLALLGWILIDLIGFQKIIAIVKNIDSINLDKILLVALIVISLCGYLPRLVALFKN